MIGTPGEPAPGAGSLCYGPPAAAGPGLLALAALVVLAGLGSDTSGRAGGAVAAALLVLAAVWVARGPVLTADAEGVRVRRLWGRQSIGWGEVHTIRADSRRRSRAIEFETAAGLVAVPASLLGRTSVTEAAQALRAVRRAAPRR